MEVVQGLGHMDLPLYVIDRFENKGINMYYFMKFLGENDEEEFK